MACEEGYYGDSCNNQCDLGCNTTSCRISDGYCECKPRHNQVEGTQCLPCPQNCLTSCNQSLYCDSCMHGFYGDLCNQACSDPCLENKCDRDGRCMCKVGYAGHPCESCPANCGDTGCTDQFKCNNCKTGYHGDYCNKTCPSNCVNKTCDIDGSCTLKACSQIHGACIECRNGFWGLRCSDKCPNNCMNNKCNQKDGTCPCTAGYQGEMCTIGMYSTTERCS